MQRTLLLVAALSAALLSGCAAVVAPVSPTLTARAAGVTPAARDAGLSVGTPARPWWHAFDDTRLNALVEEAQSRNHDLQAAVAAVKAARALADGVERQALPQGHLELQAQAQRPSTAEVDPYRQGLPRPPASRLATIGHGLAWEIDLFGRVDTASAVADRRADMAAADLHAATALLQAEVVRRYIGLRQQQQAQDSLAEESRLLTQRRELLHARERAGLADLRDVMAAEAEIAQAQSLAVQAASAVHLHVDALAVLTGRSPAVRDGWTEALLASPKMPALPPTESLVQPDDLLARRPDVARADAQLRAAIGETTLAERAHLPRLSLNLAVGLNAPFGNLGTAGAQRYAAGPALSWDWLDAGRFELQAAAARAGQQAAWHGFEQTVLNALKDSEASVRQWSATRQALDQARRAELLAANAARYTRIRVESGLEPPNAALEQAAFSSRAQRQAQEAHAATLLAFGQLQLALGAWHPGLDHRPQTAAWHRPDL